MPARYSLLLRLVLPACAIGLSAAGPAQGPLRVLESNPRFFTDGTGKAVFLAGSHIWHNFQDNGHRLPQRQDPPPAFDYKAYLDFLESRHHNFFRLWRWEAPQWTDAQPQGVVKFCEPHPWQRTGPGAARDGKPRFDLTRFNQVYFDRLRERVRMAGDRGMYVAIMLFEGWESQFTDAWSYHPFQHDNNVNAVDGDANGYYMLMDTAMGRKVLEFQEAYVRKAIDTVNGLDNVLYEICNESGSFSTKWQYHMIEFIRKVQAAKPKQHPVGMTFQWAGGHNNTLYQSPADWISPNRGEPPEDYREDPPATFRGKVIVSDTDHLWGHTGGDAVWVWKSFTRGMNVLFMEELLPSPTWQDSARDGMGLARVWSGKIDLAHMVPAGELAETGYCLANKGKEYLVFQPGNKGEFRVDLRDAQGTLSVEWINITTGKSQPGKPVNGGDRRTFTTPFGGPAAVHIK
jgi:hypothetical protein